MSRAPEHAIDLRIVGMTCGACVARVEHALAGVPGVGTVRAQLLTESARVAARSADVSPAALVAAVRAIGYDAEPLPRGSLLQAAAAGDPARREQIRRKRQALVHAVGVAAPVLGLELSGHVLQASHAAGHVGWKLLEGLLVTLLLAGPAGGPVLAGGFQALRRRAGNMDLLVSLGVTTAYLSGLAGLLTNRPQFVHFHAIAVILTAVALGRWLEALARGKTSAAIESLAKRIARTALVRRAGAAVETPVERVVPGDEVVVPVHVAAPVDGVVIDGVAELDESLMTGEPLPVTRRAGDAVRAGTLVVDGHLVLRATRTGADSTLGRILAHVAAAQAGHTPLQRLADRIAAVFTPITLAAAALTLGGWVLHAGWAGLERGLPAAVAVLVVACPCAMGLATPTAVAVASGVAAGRGILARDAAALEALGGVECVIWDKTGTLTHGRPSVAEVAPLAGDDAGGLLSLAASAELFAVHPWAGAIVAAARQRGLAIAEPDEFESIPGAGVTARASGRRVVVGRPEFLAQRGVAGVVPRVAAAPGESRVWVGVDGRLAGHLRLIDRLRPSARGAIAALRNMGVASALLTGDTQAAAEALAAELEIRDVRGDATPADKSAYVAQRRAAGRRVAMVGDGVNDAAALAAADVGVAFASGADVATESAAVQLVGSTPALMAVAVRLARATRRVIVGNLAWAFGYNAVMVPLAAVGRLPGWLAAFAMVSSSLAVVLNALRLRHVRLDVEPSPDDAAPAARK